MTSEQKQVLKEIGKRLKLTFSKMYGTISFNMHPETKDTMIKFVEDFRFREKKR